MKKQTKPKKKYLDDLWRKIVYLRAGYKSELSGALKADGIILHAHHVYGKSSLALRYDLRGGICLTQYEHLWGVHSHDPSQAKEYLEQIEKYIKKREGENIYESFKICKYISKPNIYIIELTLKETLKQLEKKAG